MPQCMHCTIDKLFMFSVTMESDMRIAFLSWMFAFFQIFMFLHKCSQNSYFVIFVIIEYKAMLSSNPTE